MFSLNLFLMGSVGGAGPRRGVFHFRGVQLSLFEDGSFVIVRQLLLALLSRLEVVDVHSLEGKRCKIKFVIVLLSSQLLDNS